MIELPICDFDGDVIFTAPISNIDNLPTEEPDVIPLYIFDLDGTLALTEHRQHLVRGEKCPGCHGFGRVRRNPPVFEAIDFGSKVVEVSDECPACNGKGLTKPDWPGFFRACVNDSPNWPVISTLVTLLDKGCDVWIWSGRSAEVMNETRAWIQQAISAERADEIELCMRREGDYTPDEQLKEAWLQGMSAFDLKRLVAVFDDRAKVVAMWRRNGVACFQVAPGDF